MSLRKLYFLWSIAACASLGIGILFYLIAMHHTYGNFSGHEDFDGLVYFIESLIVIIFTTGVISASLALFSSKPRNEKIDKVLAKKLFIFYSLFALFCILTFRFAFIYLNPISIIIFVLIPKLALDSTTDKAKARKSRWFFVGLLLTILLLGGLAFLNIVLSDPYQP
jgi:formate/nitrite transporter FocA (FNT family)